MEIVVFSFGHLKNLFSLDFGVTHFLNRHNIATTMCKNLFGNKVVFHLQADTLNYFLLVRKDRFRSYSLIKSSLITSKHPSLEDISNKQKGIFRVP